MSTVMDGTRAKKAPTPTDIPAYEAETPTYKGGGWMLFAGIMFAVAATLNIIWGIAAVSNSRFFVGNAHYILSDLNTLGWVAIGWGALEAIAVWSIWRGGTFGRWFGILVAGVGVVAAMMMIPAYPFWSLTLVAISTLIVYGLAAYGGKPELMR